MFYKARTSIFPSYRLDFPDHLSPLKSLHPSLPARLHSSYTWRMSLPSVTKVHVGCPAHNCGGRCLLIAHVQDGRIMRLETDDRPDSVAAPQLRACVRGRAYLRRQYHPDRLMHPLKRTGRRGEGKFKRISWGEALDTVTREMQRVKKRYGSSALFVPYGTGSYNQLN